MNRANPSGDTRSYGFANRQVACLCHEGVLGLQKPRGVQHYGLATIHCLDLEGPLNILGIAKYDNAYELRGVITSQALPGLLGLIV